MAVSRPNAEPLTLVGTEGLPTQLALTVVPRGSGNRLVRCVIQVIGPGTYEPPSNPWMKSVSSRAGMVIVRDIWVSQMVVVFVASTIIPLIQTTQNGIGSP